MLKDSKYYDKNVLETPFGKWYWCSVLSDINYVPKGKRVAYFRAIVSHKATLDQILNIIYRRDVEIRDGLYELKPINLSVSRKKE